ncbi:hypothetical protein BS330_04050 [Amycolatopsis keratiniphila subsp. nogabecina]|nr:hypothetical protein BS330_04050 [Amycolatopsis keratiniphila subsp. nogabecina]
MAFGAELRVRRQGSADEADACASGQDRGVLPGLGRYRLLVDLMYDIRGSDADTWLAWSISRDELSGVRFVRQVEVAGWPEQRVHAELRL